MLCIWKDLINYHSVFPSLTFSSLLNVSEAKGHCNLSQWTHCSWSICSSLSNSHCFIFLPVFQSKVWKHHSRSQRRGFFQYPQSSGSHPLNCSPHNHIKRFRKSCFLLLLCFSSAEQCPSATGSHNSLPVCAQRTSTPHPTLAISFSSSGPDPLPHLHPIVWVKAARAGLGPVQTYSSLSLDERQYSLKNVNFVSFQINSHLSGNVNVKMTLFAIWKERTYRLTRLFVYPVLCAGIPACTCVGETKSQSIMQPPRWASQCVFVTVPCQERGLERVLRTNTLWLRKCSSILASLWLANRAFLSAGCTVPVQAALRDTDPLWCSKGSSGISR